MLGLDIHQQQNPPPQHSFHHPPMAAAPSTAPPYPPPPQLQQQPVKPYSHPPFPSSSHPKSPLTDDDDCLGGDEGGDPKKKMSPWQRMKWTDGMVRLLIMAVYYIGDEVATESSDPIVTNSGSGKKKQSAVSQKKGKWKSVSRAMMEKGYYVSPQQCEDKFNDLNKRYKRVNDILGRGTACKVVENQSLLDSMDLSPKMKDEVRKLLSSKHLFFREMCAYHNSCGHGPTSGEATAIHQQHQPQQGTSHHQQQKCSHSENSSGHMAANSMAGKRAINDEDSEDDSHDDEFDDEEDSEVHSRGQTQNSHGHEEEGGHDIDTHKRARRSDVTMMMSSSMQEFNCELISIVQDGSKSPWDKKQWMKMRLLQLEEQQVSYQGKSLEIEKQRLKWVKFAGKKEREMERAKLENERKRIENERMMLLVRQKELDIQHQLPS
ncbi:hypothetical protein LINPERHAP1_LOCUS43451 [Linum perenne]